MLYERWREVAREHSSEVALRDLSTGESWTFAELARKTEACAMDGSPVFPRGISPDFVIAVLQGWRADAVVCPLEEGQARPDLRGLSSDWRHVKVTSGTASGGRNVAFSQRQLASDARNIVETMGLRTDWPNIGVISLAHSYGFSNLILPLLLHGIPLFLGSSPLPEAMRTALKDVGPVTLPAVPALWSTWRDANALPANVKLAISAGAPLPLLLEQETFRLTGLKIHNFYGATECGGIAYDNSAAPRLDPACVGRPMQHVTLANGPDGGLEVRGEAVGENYFPEPEPQLRDGVYRAPDLVEFRNGLLFLRGRAGDQINVAGRKISPELIERALAEHPEVRQCLVFGTPSNDQDRGESVVACVALKSEAPVEALRQFLLARLPAWQVPRLWWFVPDIPANDRGKISRAEWRERFLKRPRPT